MTIKHSNLWRLLVPLLSLALVAAACGGSGDEGATGSDSDAAGSDSDDGGDNGDSDSEDASDLPECPVDAHLEADGPVEVVLWHTLTALTAQTIDELVAEYNSSQDQVVVTVENQGSSYIELERKYLSGIASNDLPDIALMENILTRTLSDSETVLPAQACFDADGISTDDFNPTVVSYYSVDGNVIPAAWNTSTDVLYYNMNHFDAAGIDRDAPPSNLAELREAAQAIQDAGVADKPLVIKIGTWFFESMLNRDGVELINMNGGRDGTPTEVNFTSPEVVDFFTEIQALVTDGLMDPVPETPGQANHYLAVATQQSSIAMETSTAGTSVEAFLQGKLDVAALLDGGELTGAGLDDLGEGEVTDAAAALDINAAPLPAITQTGVGHVSGNGWYIMSTKEAEVQAAAWDFMKFIQQVDSQDLLLTQGSYLPMTPATFDDPEVNSLLDNSKAGGWLRTSYDQLEQLSPEQPGTQLGPYRDVRSALQVAVDDMLLNDADPATALATAEAEADAAITSYNEEFAG